MMSIKKGALHKQLNIPQEQKIRTTILKKILATKRYKGKKATPLMMKRVQFAYNVRHKKR